MDGWDPGRVLTDEEKEAKLLSEIEASMQAYRACKRKVAEASAKFIAERSKNARKQAAVEKYVDLLSRSKLLGARAERNLHEVEAILKQHQTVRDTTQRRVKYEQGKLDEMQKLRLEAQEIVNDMEERYNRVEQAVHHAERTGEKERLRARRAKEVRAMEEARASELQRAVEPLKKPVALLEDEWTKMKSNVDAYDVRCTESRDALTVNVVKDATLSSRFQELLWRLPGLKVEEQEGYIHGQDIDEQMESAKQLVILEQYQKAFFQRRYEDAAPSVVDGMVARNVGNIKDDEWTDPWGRRGIGNWVIKGVLERIVHSLEKEAVVSTTAELAEAKREYEEFHVIVMDQRSVNDDLQREARQQHEVADDLLRRLDMARSRLRAAQAIADEARQQAEDARIVQEEQELLADDSTRAMDDKYNERISARVKADVEILAMEKKARSVEMAKARLERAQAEYDAELDALDGVEEMVEERQKEVEVAKARTKKLEVFLEIKEGERDWQMAKEEVAMVTMEGFQNDAKVLWLKHLDSRTALQQHKRTVADKNRRDATRVNLKGALHDARAFNLAAMAYAHDLVAVSALSQPRDPGEERKHAEERAQLERLVIAMKERNIECTRQFLGGINDEARRSRDPKLVSDPGYSFGKGSLGVGRSAGVFEEGGCAFIRSQESSRPSAMKGWVSHVPNEAGAKYTGLCNLPLGEGRHTWDFHLDVVGGKGAIYLGVVQDRDAFRPARVEGVRHFSQTILETTKTCTVWDVGGSESDSVDLDAYCLGDDHRSWAIASDGVKVHRGVLSEFCGQTFGQGDVVTCLWDSSARTLVFLLAGKRLGATIEGVEGPVVPAVSVTRSRTCQITVANYARN